MSKPNPLHTLANVERLRLLAEMLTTKRPMGSRAERRFRRAYLHHLPGAYIDAHRNIHVVVPKPDGSDSAVLWSSHTDTVHRHGGVQRLAISKRHIQLAKGETSNCLGADDTVGVWIMREMILHKVPGHYVFHWGEERGGIGSSALAADQWRAIGDRAWMLRIKAAIAFDRRGTRDVITHQGYGRCCSDAFAWSLAQVLKSGGAGKYRPSEWGLYTDTAEYTRIIPECTNLSVGYEQEHRATERVDFWHALKVMQVMLQFDESRLVIERDPNQPDQYPDPMDLTDQDIDWEGGYSWERPTVQGWKDNYIQCSDGVWRRRDEISDDELHLAMELEALEREEAERRRKDEAWQRAANWFTDQKRKQDQQEALARMGGA